MITSSSQLPSPSTTTTDSLPPSACPLLLKGIKSDSIVNVVFNVVTERIRSYRCEVAFEFFSTRKPRGTVATCSNLFNTHRSATGAPSWYLSELVYCTISVRFTPYRLYKGSCVETAVLNYIIPIV